MNDITKRFDEKTGVGYLLFDRMAIYILRTLHRPSVFSWKRIRSLPSNGRA